MGGRRGFLTDESLHPEKLRSLNFQIAINLAVYIYDWEFKCSGLAREPFKFLLIVRPTERYKEGGCDIIRSSFFSMIGSSILFCVVKQTLSQHDRPRKTNRRWFIFKNQPRKSKKQWFINLQLYHFVLQRSGYFCRTF